MYCLIEYTDIKKSVQDEISNQSSKLTEEVESVNRSVPGNKTLLVNPNCPIQILLDYVREKVGFDKIDMYDFCEAETGKLLDINQLKPWHYATEIMQPLQTYVIVFYEKNKNGEYRKLEPLLSRLSPQYSELLLRIKRQMGSSFRSSTSVKKHRKSSLSSKDSTKDSIPSHMNSKQRQSLSKTKHIM